MYRDQHTDLLNNQADKRIRHRYRHRQTAGQIGLTQTHRQLHSHANWKVELGTKTFLQAVRWVFGQGYEDVYSYTNGQTDRQTYTDRPLQTDS